MVIKTQNMYCDIDKIVINNNKTSTVNIHIHIHRTNHRTSILRS